MLAMLIYFTMLLYYLKCRKKHKVKSPRVANTNKSRIMLSSKCVVCDSKKSKFVRKQEVERLLSMIGKILILGLLLM